MEQENTEGKSPTGRVHEALTFTPGRALELDFGKEIEELQRSPDGQKGMARKVLVRYPNLQITLRTMKANTQIPEHSAPGRACIYAMRGHIRMHADGKLFDLPQGKSLILDPNVTHDVQAVEESAFLVIIAPVESSGR
jgi:quercetin dioxygenase-like cupin family protein